MCTPKEFQMALMKWMGEAIGLGDCFSQLSLVSSCREATALLHQSLGHGHYMYDNAKQGKKEKKKRVVVGNLTYIYGQKDTRWRKKDDDLFCGLNNCDSTVTNSLDTTIDMHHGRV